jgi:Carboxypeptidase regulatory-like domain/Cupin domain
MTAMRSLLVCSLVMAGVLPVSAQTRAKPAAASTLIVRVTDSFGAPLPGVKVAAIGPVERNGVTDAAGEARLASMRPGSYRLRFEGENIVTLERDVTVRAAQPATVDVTLSAAPPPPAPPPPAPKPAPVPTNTGPPAEARTVSITDFLDRNLIGSREPVKTSVLACSPSTTTALLQIREPLKDRVHTNADELLYVVAGEGSLQLGGQETPLVAGTLSLVPRGTTHVLQRRGRNPLILLSTLTDTPCSAFK